MTDKRKTDTSSALEQFSALDSGTKYLLLSFLQMAAAVILNVKQVQKPDTAQEVQHNE